jgi:transcriptional regulator with XRE-family HTH domain
MTIGERIKQARHMRCLSQRELAKKESVSAQSISEYERNLDVPSSSVLISLSKRFQNKMISAHQCRGSTH